VRTVRSERRTATCVLTLLLVGGAAACGGRDGTTVRADVVDSAGIVIVTSAAPDAVVEPVRAWSIGGTGDDNPLLAVTDLAVTADGMLLVANSGTAEVIAIDSAGQVRWRFGRRGAGPGEFQRDLSLATIGDTVYAYQFGLGRLTAIAPGGTLQRTMPVALDGPNIELRGGFSDGSLLFTARHLTGMKPGLNADSVVHQRLSLLGVPLGTVGWTRGSNVDFVMAGMGPNLDEQAFGPVTAVATAGEWLARTTGRDAEVQLRDPTGRLRRLVRWDEVPAPVRDADREAYRAARLAAVRSEMERRMLEDWLAHATFADTLPATGLVALGRDGRVLVSAQCAPGHGACRWREFDGDGRWVRTLRLPVRAVRAVLAGEVLVTLSEDADGVERLDAWRVD
jgi:hypothetical protein